MVSNLVRTVRLFGTDRSSFNFGAETVRTVRSGGDAPDTEHSTGTSRRGQTRDCHQ